MSFSIFYTMCLLTRNKMTREYLPVYVYYVSIVLIRWLLFFNLVAILENNSVLTNQNCMGHDTDNI